MMESGNPSINQGIVWLPSEKCVIIVKDLKCRGKNNYINSLTCQVENSKLETDE